MRKLWSETFTGKKFYYDVESPSDNDYDIQDIAAGLAKQCRYNGMCSKFLSVAEHSCLVHDLLLASGHDDLAAAGLLHDAHEAYTGDMISPLKEFLQCDKLNSLNSGIQKAIHQAFEIKSLTILDRKAIKWADRVVALNEAAEVMPSQGDDWEQVEDMRSVKVNCWTEEQARFEFLNRWVPGLGQFSVEMEHLFQAPEPDRNIAVSAMDVQEGGSHYKAMPIQPIEFVLKNKIPYIEGNVIKYICRHRSKNGAEDIKKAIHYLELLLEMEYGQVEAA